MLTLIQRIGSEFNISVVVCSHLLGEVERICDWLVAIDGGRLLRADRVAAMTVQRDVLAIEVDEGTEELALELRGSGLTVRREGQTLVVPLESDETYDLILGAVAALDLPLHRLDQRRHRVSELFTDAQEGLDATR
jgi:ABC-2 type transport system ATP-binding protein